MDKLKQTILIKMQILGEFAFKLGATFEVYQSYATIGS
jgi:hypothetical protein